MYKEQYNIDLMNLFDLKSKRNHPEDSAPAPSESFSQLSIDSKRYMESYNGGLSKIVRSYEDEKRTHIGLVDQPPTIATITDSQIEKVFQSTYNRYEDKTINISTIILEAMEIFKRLSEGVAMIRHYTLYYCNLINFSILKIYQ